MVKYPIGKQDFKSLRDEGYVYVDKTHFIPKLIEEGSYYFLGRPRRFGKSLFLSTLEYFFRGERELFVGLNVESYKWKWEKYPVLHFDLNGIDYTVDGNLALKLNQFLNDSAKRYGLALPDRDPAIRFSQLINHIYEATGLQVVVLIDEYDKPVIDNIDNEELRERNRDTLRGFYSVLKSADRYLKMVFMTGVTKFGQMNVFSGLNNIRDISLKTTYNTICGITEDELKSNFESGIKKLAEVEHMDFDGALKLLKDNYDGYHFSENCPDLYNPFSLINALADSTIDPYWYATGTPKFLADLLIKQKYDLEDLNNITISRDRLLNINNSFDDPVSLLYQTGYLTIKEYDKEIREYTLGYPNLEVEKAFFNYLIPNYTVSTNKDIDSQIDEFKRNINKGEVQKAIEALEAFSAGISYDMIPSPETERHFQMLLYMFIKLVVSKNVKTIPEYKTSDGRIDLLIETPKYVYIMEIKRDGSSKEAIRQIEDKNYPLQFKDDPRKIFLIGLNFSSSKKRIDSFEIKTYP